MRRFLRRFPVAAAFAAVLMGVSAVVGPSFGGARASEAGADAAPAMLRRLTEAQYRRTIADVFGADIKVIGRFEPDLRVEGLLAVGTTAVSTTPAGLEQYEEIARGIAAQVTDDAHRGKLVGCAPDGDDPDGAKCAERFLTRVGLRLYRRPLARAEVRLLTTSALTSAERLGGFDAGLAASLAGMLTSPHFLFRIDNPAPGGKSVDGFSKATRLSYLLWNTAPDEALLAAAASGALDTPEGLAGQVDRLIASSRFAEGVSAFFTDYLMLDDIDTLSKDVLIFPAFTSSVAAAAREQTLRTITHLLVERNGDYRELFTSRRIAMTRALGPIYDIPVGRDGWYIHEFPAGDPRGGLLTHASLLALHSHPGRTSPTLRGKAIREVLRCEKVPTPPANVNFAVVQDVDNPTLKTTRARLQAHLDDESCASCHKITDPIGFGLEQFDGAGQFRTRENGEIIDVSGMFEKTAYNGAAELGRLFHDSPDVSACLVRTAWRYASGRDPRDVDEPAIEALTGRFKADGHRLTALLRAIALDPAFYAMPARTLPTRTATKQKGTGS
jgi:hypothetical protein